MIGIMGYSDYINQEVELIGQITDILTVSAGGFGQYDNALLEINGKSKIIYEFDTHPPEIGQFLYLKRDGKHFVSNKKNIKKIRDIYTGLSQGPGPQK
jgi:hypothetical protein